LKQTDAEPYRAKEGECDPGRRRKERELLEKACRASGRNLGFWASFTDGLDESSLALLAARAHMVSPEISVSCDHLQRDLREAVSLFSQVGDRDRQAFLRALRGLAALRKGRQN